MLYDIFFNLLSGFLGSTLSFSFCWLIFLVSKRKFKGWGLEIWDGDKCLCSRPVGQKKAESVLDDQAELSVFLKGVCSPYGWLNLDPISDEAFKIGLVARQEKKWVVDLSKNPPKRR